MSSSCWRSFRPSFLGGPCCTSERTIRQAEGAACEAAGTHLLERPRQSIGLRPGRQRCAARPRNPPLACWRRDAGGSRTHGRAALQAACQAVGTSVFPMRNAEFGMRNWMSNVWVFRIPNSTILQRPRQESNLVFDRRGVACDVHHTPRTFSNAERRIQKLATDDDLRPSAFRIPNSELQVPRRGVEPRPAASKAAMPPPHSRGVLRPPSRRDVVARWARPRFDTCLRRRSAPAGA